MIYQPTKAFHAQSPTDNLDNEFEFLSVPVGDRIVSASVSTDMNTMSITSIVIIANSVVCWVTGGTPGSTATLTCRATTADNRVYNRSATMPIRAIVG